MKKILFLASGLFLLLLLLLFAYRSERRRSAGDEEVRIGLVLTGRKDLDGWNQSHYDALRSLSGEMNFTLLCMEDVSEFDDSVLAAIDTLAGQGAKIICLAGMGYGESAATALDKYPDITFLNASGVEQGHNLVSFFGKMYQARYLSGLVAGLQTETGEIGYVAAMPVNEVIRGINSFAVGVRAANPKAVVRVRYTGLWDDPEKERRAAALLLGSYAADVVTYHQNTAAAAKEADSRGRFSITYHTANNGELSDKCLTGAVWHWAPFYRERIEDSLYRRKQKRFYWVGLEKGIVDLAPFSARVPPETVAMVMAERERIKNGEWDVFRGPMYDNAGVLRIEAGSAMSDDQLITDFDWYVDGVVVIE